MFFSQTQTMLFRKIPAILSSGVVAAVVAFSAASALAMPIDKFFTIQPIRICNDAGASCATVNLFQAEMTKIYAQAGVAPIFLSTTQLNSTAFLNTTGVAAIDVAGSGQNANSLVLNAWYTNSLSSGSGTLFGEAWVGGNGIAINSSAVNSFNSGNGRRDTLAHEAGHNLGNWSSTPPPPGLRHTTLGAGGADNLMTSGNSRSVPNGVGNINPDGTQLSKLTTQQIAAVRNSQFVQAAPDVTVDTVGSTPFNTNDFFRVDFNTAPTGTSLVSMTLDLAPVNAFFDPINVAPGIDGSPFALSGLVGLTAGDIAVTNGAGGAAIDGGSTLKLSFASGSFMAGDSFDFGIDIDLFSAIDTLGASPAELVGMLFDFQFSNGFAGQAALDSDLITGSTSVTQLLAPISIIGPTGPGPKIRGGSFIDVPEPAPVSLFLLGLVALGFYRRMNKGRI